MKNNIEVILKKHSLIIIILASLILAFCVEIGIYQLPALRYGSFEEEYTIEKGDLSELESKEVWNEIAKEERNRIEIEQENAKLLAEANGEEYIEITNPDIKVENDVYFRRSIETKFQVILPAKTYCGKVAITIPGAVEKLTYQLEGIQNEETQKEETQNKEKQYEETQYDYRIGSDIVSVGKALNQIVYTVTSQSEIDTTGMSVTISTLFSFNELRFLFFVILFLGIFVFILKKEFLLHNLERLFFVICITLGSLLILCTGTNLTGYDEHVHFARAYAMSFGTTIETTESAMRMKANDIPEFDNRQERKLVEAYEELNHDYSWADISTQSRFVSYADRSYLPMGILMRLARILNFPFASAMMFAKFGNLLAYALLGYTAVRISKFKKELVAAIALIPNCIFAATGFTYDGIVNGFLLLAVVLTGNLMIAGNQMFTGSQMPADNKDKETAVKYKITPVMVFLILGAYIAGSTAKPVYMIMSLMLAFLSNDYFLNKKRAWIFRLSVIGLTGLFLYVIFFPPVSTSANYELMGNLAYAGDKRNQGTSVLGQLGFMFSNLLQYTGILLRMMGKDLASYLFGPGTFFNYGYLGGLKWLWTLGGLGLLCAGALRKNEEDKLQCFEPKVRILNAIMIFGLTAVIYTSMYVSYTPVGSQVIEGVQGRYFIPLILPFLFVITQKKKLFLMKDEFFVRIVIGFCTVANLWSIYWFALKPLNF